MKYNIRNNQGQSLLEVILAVAIFALIGAALTSMILGSFNSLTRSSDMIKAQALADEAAEAVRSIKGGAWNKLSYNRSALATNSSRWFFQGEGTTETIGRYTRTIDLEDVCRGSGGEIVDCPGSYKDIHTRKAVIGVEWEVGAGITNSVDREVFLSNWDSVDWVQTDWSGGDGQEIWSDSSKYNFDDGNIATGTVGRISLLSGDTRDDGFDLVGDSSNNWPFTDPANYTYDPDKLEVVDGVARLASASGGCGGTVVQCGDINNPGNCHDQIGCNWKAGDCNNDPGAVACSDLGNESDCTTQMDCSWSEESYPDSAPSISPADSYSVSGVESWDGFTETAVKNGGEIYYQLSSDNGSTWQYWDGSNWTAAGEGDRNTADVIDANIGSFDTSGEQIKFRAFLQSDGSHQVELDNINIAYSGENSVWDFSAWDVDPGEETPSGARRDTGGNPGGYAEITIPESNNDQIGGYWEQPFTNYEVDPEGMSLDFDHKAVDHNGTADISEVRIYVDTSSGEPVNRVGDPISISSESGWIEDVSIDPSSAVSATGTYYLKLAYWVETSGGKQGPFTVGFDNVDLDPGSGEHPDSGYLVSSDYDTGTSSAIQTIEWNESAPSACDIRFQVKTASTQAGLDDAEWSGPEGVDGDETDYFNSPSGQFLFPDHNGDRWIRYKTVLTGDGHSTPVLEEVKLNYK